MKDLINHWKLVVLICLTLGLAPFFPEPHLWGKIKWIAGGAVGMGFPDWFDVALHGFPFVLLLRLAVLKIIGLART
ncbi:MAG: hypothetical protein WBN18_15245 [Flavobacteriaceae bacterium]